MPVPCRISPVLTCRQRKIGEGKQEVRLEGGVEGCGEDRGARVTDRRLLQKFGISNLNETDELLVGSVAARKKKKSQIQKKKNPSMLLFFCDLVEWSSICNPHEV